MPKSLEHHLKFLQLRRDIQQSNSTWMLSVLASIFLPLSLASSVLGMQARFVDLHYLLYDFCGVAVLFLTLLGLILALVKLYVRLTHWVTNLRGFRKVISQVTFVMTILILWALVLSSFLVGMSSDVGLGGRILGFGIAGITGLGLAFFFAIGFNGRSFQKPVI